MPRFSDDEGMITIVTLWILVILSVMAIGLGYRTGIDLKIAGYHLDQVQAVSLARSGVARAAAELTYDQSMSNVDHLGESWNDDRDAFRDVSLGNGKYRVGYPEDRVGSVRSLYDDDEEELSDEGWKFGVIDEERKININKATDEVIDRLRRVGLDLPPLEEAEPGFLEKDELSVVNFPQLFPMNLFAGAGGEIDPEQFELARKYLTVYGDGKVNINTASRDILSVLGMSGNLVDRIVDYRAGPDRTEGTADDTPFTDLGSVAAVLNEFGELSPRDLADLSYFVSTEAITVESHFFRIDSMGILDGGKVVKRVSAVLERTDEDETIIRCWYER